MGKLTFLLLFSLLKWVHLLLLSPLDSRVEVLWHLFMYFTYFWCGTAEWTQDLTHARRVFYHLSHASDLLFVFFFLDSFAQAFLILTSLLPLPEE
jgi:hypothetical protein